MAGFESCRFDFKLDAKNGLTPSKRKKSERRNSCYGTLFKCKECGKLYDTRSNLLEHKLEHNDFKCPICREKVVNKMMLREHLSVVHGLGKQGGGRLDTVKTMLEKKKASEAGSGESELDQAYVKQVEQQAIEQQIHSLVSDSVIDHQKQYAMFKQQQQQITLQNETPPPEDQQLSSIHHFYEHLKQQILCASAATTKSDTNAAVSSPAVKTQTPPPLTPNPSIIQKEHSDVATEKKVVETGSATFAAGVECEVNTSNNKQDTPSLPKLAPRPDLAQQAVNSPTAAQGYICINVPVVLPALNRENSSAAEDIASVSVLKPCPQVATVPPYLPSDQRNKQQLSVAGDLELGEVRNSSDNSLIQQGRSSQKAPATGRGRGRKLRTHHKRCSGVSTATKDKLEQKLQQKMQEKQQLKRQQNLREHQQKQHMEEEIQKYKMKQMQLQQQHILQHQLQQQLIEQQLTLQQKPIQIVESNVFAEQQTLDHAEVQLSYSKSEQDESFEQGRLVIDEDAPLDLTRSTVTKTSAETVAKRDRDDTQNASGALNLVSIQTKQKRLKTGLSSMVAKLWENKISGDSEKNAENTNEPQAKYWKEVEDGIVQCKFCSHKFGEGDISQHMLYFHGLNVQEQSTNQAYPCDWEGCNDMFNNLIELRNHVRKHEQARPGLADAKGNETHSATSNSPQGASTKSPSNVNDRIIASHKKFKCNLCSYISDVHFSMFTHMKNQHSVQDPIMITKLMSCLDEVPSTNGGSATITSGQFAASQVIDVKPLGTPSINNQERPDMVVDMEQTHVEQVGTAMNPSLNKQPHSKQVKQEAMDDGVLPMGQQSLCDTILQSHVATSGAHAVYTMHTSMNQLKMASLATTGNQTSQCDTVKENTGIETNKCNNGSMKATHEPVKTTPTAVCKLCNMTFGNENDLKTHYELGANPKDENISNSRGIMPCTVIKKSNLQLSANSFSMLNMAWQNSEEGTNKTTKKKWKASKKARYLSNGEVITYQCDCCQFAADDKPSLDTHTLQEHGFVTESKEFFCSFCGSQFNSRANLKLHVTTQHLADGTDTDGGESIHSESTLDDAGCTRAASIESDLSASGISLSSGDGTDEALTDAKPLCCKYPGCDRVFKVAKYLKVHQMLHTDQKPLKCTLCDYSCRQRNSMNWHMKTKHALNKHITYEGRTIYVTESHTLHNIVTE